MHRENPFLRQSATPWRDLLQLALLFVVVGAIYLFLRYAVLLPDLSMGWVVAINAVTVVGAGILFWRLNQARRAYAAAAEPVTCNVAVKIIASIGGLALVLGLTLPIWIVLYFVWLGGQLWR